MKLPIFSKPIKLLLLVSCVAGMQADFVSLSIWERTTTTGEKQHLVCLGDRHDWNSKADKQSDDLINWLKQRSNPHDVVLIEDHFDVAYIIDQARAYLKEHNKVWDDSCLQDVQVRYDNELRRAAFFGGYDGLLSCIGQKLACHKSIRRYNVEFRLLQNEIFCLLRSQDWQYFLENELHGFVVKQIIKEVSLYNDSPFLNSYYQQCIKPLSSILKESRSISKRNIIKLLRDYNGRSKILDFLPHQDSFYCKLYGIEYGLSYNLYYDIDNLAEYLLCELMDARLLHHIYQEHTQKDQANVVVVCTGAAHVWNVETKLDKLGYARIYRDGASSVGDIEQGMGLSKKLSFWLNELSQRQLFLQRELLKAELERKRLERFELVEPVERVELEERIKRRIKHMLLDFDTDMTYPNYSPAKQQAKL